MLKEFLAYNLNWVYRIKIFMGITEGIIFLVGLLLENCDNWLLIGFAVTFIPFSNFYWSRTTYDTFREELNLKISFKAYDYLSLLFLIGAFFIFIDMAVQNGPIWWTALLHRL